MYGPSGYTAGKIMDGGMYVHAGVFSRDIAIFKGL